MALSVRPEGHVRIYSEVGEGTTVKIYLSRHTGDEDTTERESRAQNAARAVGAETILVVEDDEALRSYTTEILAELGYRVLAAHNGRPRFDISREPGSICCSPIGHAGRHEWPRACRRGGAAAARAEGSVHDGLYAQCHRTPWPA